MRTCSNAGCEREPRRKEGMNGRIRWLRTCSDECAMEVARSSGKRGGKISAPTNGIKVGRAAG